jgi:hypothetical protein
MCGCLPQGSSAAGVCREMKKPDGIGLRCTLNWCGLNGGRNEL